MFVLSTAVVLFLFFFSEANGHGSIVYPPPRNAIDHDVFPWNGSVPSGSKSETLNSGWCLVPNSAAAISKLGGRVSGRNGQACFWFSAGCSIGCNLCDGVTRGPIPNIPCKWPGNKTEMCARKMPVCDNGLKAPTLPREARTVNTDVEDGADNDFYMYSPWRAPGSSYVVDPCGVAGGVKDSWKLGSNPYGISYINTSHARAGDVGTTLQRRDTGVVWTAGDVVEVSWTVNANHGGGYYYRLCKLPSNGSQLTEACFQETPLRFVGNTSFRWNGDPTTDEEIDSVFVETGTHPAGSRWAMNPIPRNDTAQTGASFAPKCREVCSGCTAGGAPGCSNCRCTGEWGVPNLEIVDNVALPWMLPPGDYVVGFRWDTEESNQVWNSCADITIKAHPDFAEQQTREPARIGHLDGVPCPLPRGQCFGDEPRQNSDLQRNSHVAHVPLNKTLAYARQLLQSAVMVEHSTIPLYLSAMWSMVNSTSQAVDIIHSVVIEEMLHMTIAANVLNAIGGAPMIDAPYFIPDYPLDLPLTNVSVGIEPMSLNTTRKFMLIEGITHEAKSIGAAYSYILSLLEALVEEYGEQAIFTGNFSYQVQAQAFGTPPKIARKIANFSDAVEALLQVSEQGGGCPVPGQEDLWPKVSNISAGPMGGVYSHWARFAEINSSRAWQHNDTVQGGPTGAALPGLGEVHFFEPNPNVSSYDPGTEAHTLAHNFASNYTALLVMLHNAFNGLPQTLFSTYRAMHSLTTNAMLLLSTPDPRNLTVQGAVMGPTWQYIPEASQFALRRGRARPIIARS